VLADQFRDGNLPAQMEPLEVVQRAFAAVSSTVNEYYYRGDSACHESGLVDWLRHEQRQDGPTRRAFANEARVLTAKVPVPGELLVYGTIPGVSRSC